MLWVSTLQSPIIKCRKTSAASQPRFQYTRYMDTNKQELNIKIHEHGFVRLVDSMGDDNRIVQSARVSYGVGTKSFREDRGLIRYLLRNAHTSPFEQVVFTFHVKMPIFVARQWIRHRTARLNEISARYSVMKDEFYEPADKDINSQSSDNKQSRNEELFPAEILNKIKGSITHIHKENYHAYQELLDKKVSREIARIILPTSLYTEMYWQIDLHNLFHFLKLRLDAHAQREIRVYAQALYKLIKNICPNACEAFEDYILNKVEIYKQEHVLLQELLKDHNLDEKILLRIAKEKDLDMQPKEIALFLKKITSIKTK